MQVPEQGHVPLTLLDVDGATIVIEIWSGDPPSFDAWCAGRSGSSTSIRFLHGRPLRVGSPAATVTTSEDAIRIVLADDAVLLREALAAALEASGFRGRRTGRGRSRAACARRPASGPTWRRGRPDAADAHDGGAGGRRHIRRTQPEVAILVLSQYIETRYAIDLIREDPAGIGYLLKERVTRLDDLADAVRRVAAGGSVIDPEVVARLLGRPRSHSPLDELTPREREILALMAEGRSNAAIAQRLTLELKTVEGHVRAVFSKLGLEPAGEDHRRVLAVLAYLRDAGPTAS